MDKTTQKYFDSITKNGHISSWQNGYPGQSWAKAKSEQVSLLDSKKGFRLFGADSYRKYSRNTSYQIHVRYLCGYSDNQYWCVRVSPKIDTINDALEWIKPASVKTAENKGKKVLRQGDFYFIPTKNWNLSELLHTNHDVWHQVGRSGAYIPYSLFWEHYPLNSNIVVIDHNEHKNLILSAPYKAVHQKSVFGAKDNLD